MKYYLTLIITLLFQLAYAQSNLEGKWGFDSFPESIEMDDEGREMAQMFFKDMSLSLDSVNFSLILMGSEESGTYTSNENDLFEFNSSSGTSSTVLIKELDENKIIFGHNDKEFILKRFNEKPLINPKTNSLNKAVGISINKDLLCGKWMHNGQTSGIIKDLKLKHNSDELVSYSFSQSGEFLNKAPFEMILGGTWNVANDQKTLIVGSEHKIERFKVMKLNESELELYNPKNETVYKFLKAH